jgi:hypothetical protein
MVNLQLEVHDTYILGSPPPTVACPYCPRHFKVKSGRTRHIKAKHSGVPEPHAPEPATDPLRISSSPESPQPPPSFYGTNSTRSVSPVPSDLASPYLDIDNHQFDQGSLGGDPDVNLPDAPSIRRTYHPKLNGVLISSLIYRIHQYLLSYLY